MPCLRSSVEESIALVFVSKLVGGVSPVKLSTFGQVEEYQGLLKSTHKG
jgi:hypothetical protein